MLARHLVLDRNRIHFNLFKFEIVIEIINQSCNNREQWFIIATTLHPVLLRTNHSLIPYERYDSYVMFPKSND
jgi:hypothetical protein